MRAATRPHGAVKRSFVRHLNLPSGAPLVRDLLAGLRVAHPHVGGQLDVADEPHGWDEEVAADAARLALPRTPPLTLALTPTLARPLP